MLYDNQDLDLILLDYFHYSFNKYFDLPCKLEYLQRYLHSDYLFKFETLSCRY